LEVTPQRFKKWNVQLHGEKKRSVILPAGLGRVGQVDDRESKTTAYAARARAGGCITWWNPMDKSAGVDKSIKFIGAYSATVESLTHSSAVTVSQLGRYPPIKGAAHAPVNDQQGALSMKDPACMAQPSPDDVFFQKKTAQKSGTVTVTRVELCPNNRANCQVCKGSTGQKIAKGSLRFVYEGSYRGKVSNKFIHVGCASVDHFSGVSVLDECQGFSELSNDHQSMVRHVVSGVCAPSSQ